MLLFIRLKHLRINKEWSTRKPIVFFPWRSSRRYERWISSPHCTNVAAASSQTLAWTGMQWQTRNNQRCDEPSQLLTNTAWLPFDAVTVGRLSTAIAAANVSDDRYTNRGRLSASSGGSSIRGSICQSLQILWTSEGRLAPTKVRTAYTVGTHVYMAWSMALSPTSPIAFLLDAKVCCSLGSSGSKV